MSRPWRLTAALVLLAGALAAALIGSGAHERLARATLERALNRRAGSLFAGSIRLGALRLDRRLRVSIDGLQATLHRGSARVPIAVGSLACRQPLTELWRGRPLTLAFERAHLGPLRRRGLRGTARIEPGAPARLRLEAMIDALDLQDLTWISPAHLAGSEGLLAGTLRLDWAGADRAALEAELAVARPGGRLPARFFEPLLPYVPAARELQQLAQRTGAVRFDAASLQVRQPARDRIVTVLTVAVPEYNLDIHLNLELRMTGQDLLGELLGLTRALSSH